jgi:hypothetical protein
VLSQKKTVNVLGDLDKSDAELFTRLCGFGWVIVTVIPLVFDADDEVYNRHGINFVTLSHLESLGLVQFDNLAGFQRMGLPKRFNVSYYGKPVELTLPKDAENVLELGKVYLTRAGEELARVCGARPVDGFFDFVYDRWAASSLVPKKETDQSAPADV